MAWFDIVGGLAGGLQKGLGQWQRAQEAQKTEERQNALLKVQQDQEARAKAADAQKAAMERYAALESNREFSPQEDPEMVRLLGPGAFVKGPTGGIMKKKSAAEQLQEEQLNDYLAGKPVREGARTIAALTTSQQAQLVNQLRTKYGDNWLANPDKMSFAERRAVGKLILDNPDVFVRPEETPGVAAARATAAALVPTREANIQNLITDNLANLTSKLQDVENKFTTNYQGYLKSDQGLIELQQLKNQLRTQFPKASPADIAQAADTQLRQQKRSLQNVDAQVKVFQDQIDALKATMPQAGARIVPPVTQPKITGITVIKP